MTEARQTLIRTFAQLDHIFQRKLYSPAQQPVADIPTPNLDSASEELSIILYDPSIWGLLATALNNTTISVETVSALRNVVAPETLLTETNALALLVLFEAMWANNSLTDEQFILLVDALSDDYHTKPWPKLWEQARKYLTGQPSTIEILNKIAERKRTNS